MASKLDIENWALIYLEEETEADPLQSIAGKTIDILYNSTYRGLLKKNSYGWSFARKVISLNQVTNVTELNGYANTYQLPTDYLQMIRLNSSFQTFIIIGKLIYSNDDKFNMTYIYEVNEDQISDEFGHAVAYGLAYKAAGKVTGKKDIKEDLYYKAQEQLAHAIQLDIAQMDTQQYMPAVNAIYDSHWQSGFPMGSFSGQRSVVGGNS